MELDTLPAPEARKRHRRLHVPARVRRFLRWGTHTPKGILVLGFLTVSFGAAFTAGSMAMLTWTESPSFCGICHTMGPERAAYSVSPHHDVNCGECHVAPGISGWVKSKVAGSRQLLQLITGTYPKPIPPPAHVDLPPVQDTCMRCHPLDTISAADAPATRVSRTHYAPDITNTPEQIYVLLQPSQAGPDPSIGGGVHWHVRQEVTYLTPDDNSSIIDEVDIRFTDGSTKEYVARPQVAIRSDVIPDIHRLQRIEDSHRMDCLDCHNRVGHEIPSPSEAVDDAIGRGEISGDLPFVKRYAVALVSANYASYEAADEAIGGLREMYEDENPQLVALRGGEIDQAISALEKIYRQVATPGMQVTATTYPSNLGHLSSTGCFRCHDGNHFQVINGALTDKPIPSACNTCHSFPKVGLAAAGGQVTSSGEPANHLAAGGILANHPSLANALGVKACMFCHQPVYCAGCHTTTDIVGPNAP